MDKDFHLKAGELTGHAQAMLMLRIMAEAMEFLAVKKAVEGGAQKAYDMTEKEYIKMRLGNKSYDTYNRRCSELQELGVDIWSIKKLMGWGTSEIQALAALPEGEKSNIRVKNNYLEMGEEKVPLEKDAIEAAFSSIFNRAVNAEKNEKAEKRVAENHHKTIEKLHRDIERYENRDDRYEKNPNLLEEEYIIQMEGFRLAFDQFMKRIDPESEKMREFFRDEDEHGKDKKHKPTVKMRACYLEILGYMKKMTMSCYGMAEDLVGTADMFPENVYTPEMAAEAVANMKARSDEALKTNVAHEALEKRDKAFAHEKKKRGE